MDVQAPRRVASCSLRIGAVLAAAALVVTPAGQLGAQNGPPTATAAPQWEVRVDGTAATANAAHVGLGLNVRSGWYLRSGISVATGVVEGPDDFWRTSHRVDLTTRFLLDPFGERRRAFYAGGGVTVRADQDADPAARLLVIVGFEGNPERQRVPSIELGLGGGVRLGVVIRAKRSGAR
jgi:hypothetical protein